MPSARQAGGAREKAAGRPRGASRPRPPTVRDRIAAYQDDARRAKLGDGEKARGHCERVGRPSALTERLVYAIGEMVLLGNYRETAARACGVSVVTLRNWLAKGEECEGMDPGELTDEQLLHVEFLFVLRSCEAQSEVDLLAEARRGETGWQAPMTILERRFPAHWKKRDEIEFSGEVATRAALSKEQEAEELAAFGMPAAAAVARGPEAVEPPEDA